MSNIKMNISKSCTKLGNNITRWTCSSKFAYRTYIGSPIPTIDFSSRNTCNIYIWIIIWAIISQDLSLRHMTMNRYLNPITWF
jgi:hypothetical protein